MSFKHKKLRSPALAALLVSLSSFALAPGLLIGSGTIKTVAEVLPKPHAEQPPAQEKPACCLPPKHRPVLHRDIAAASTETDDEAGDETAQADSAPAPQQTTSAAHGSVELAYNHAPYSHGFYAIGGGFPAAHDAAANPDVNTRVTSVNQTFAPNDRVGTTNDAKNGTPSGNDKSDTSDSDQQTGDTDFVDNGDHHDDTHNTDHPPIVATVPEPSSFALLGAGLVGLVLARRRASR